MGGAPPAGQPPVTAPSSWLTQRERGTLFWITLSFRLAVLVGRRPMRLGVAAVALWYRLFDRAVVRASRDWLARVHGRRSGFRATYRHLRTFAQVTLDRAFLFSRHIDALRFTTTGDQLLRQQVRSGRGAVLLGAHLGSYEAMRAAAFVEDVPIHVVGYFRNAAMINALLQRLSPQSSERIIHLGDDPVGVMSRVRGRIDAGELVALLGDRVGLNERVVPASFFGAEAAFPAGPFLLASLLRCPVYLVFGLYFEPNHYDLHCERFADRIELPRRDRQQHLQTYVQRYAARLEDYCRRAPDNWFNFFDFWSRA
jgi:predicted LPLAT superfamily acyltransferase